MKWLDMITSWDPTTIIILLNIIHLNHGNLIFKFFSCQKVNFIPFCYIIFLSCAESCLLWCFHFLFKPANMTCSKSTVETLEKDKKYVQMTSVTSFWCFLINFEYISHLNVSVVDFEPMNVCWDVVIVIKCLIRFILCYPWTYFILEICCFIMNATESLTLYGNLF